MLKSHDTRPVSIEQFLLTVEEDRAADKRAQVINFFKAMAKGKAKTP